MEQKDLKEIMLYQLGGFNDEGVELSEDTIHSEVLSATDGKGLLTSKNIYRQNIQWSLNRAKVEKKPWPKSWMDLTVSELAGRLLIFLLMLISVPAMSQVTVHVGGAKTDLKNTAINVAFSYLKSVDSIISGNEYTTYGNNSWFVIAPEVNFQTGTSDAFSAITVKAQGLLSKFRVTSVHGYETPDINKTMHLFPMSIGAESNNRFDFINGIAEVGYQPFYQSASRNSPAWIKSTRFGVYLQGGYKFKFLDTSAVVPEGGQVDQSGEDISSSILRAKGHFSINANQIIKLGDFKIGLVGTSNVWRDIRNGLWHYQLQGTGRIHLTADMYMDVIYSRGSGAPLFNSGEQFSTGLTFTF